MGEEEPRDEQPGQQLQRSADEMEAARSGLEEARRRIRVPHPASGEHVESLESTRIAYEMELAEHRSTTERLHSAELAARDLTIEHQRDRIAELEAEVRRLRTALQVLTGRPIPELQVTSSPEVGED